MGCGQSKINLYPRRNKNGGKGNSAKKSGAVDKETDEEEGTAGGAATTDDKDEEAAPTKHILAISCAHPPPSLETSASQQDFFKMLDEKIDKGRDYDSSSESEMRLEHERRRNLIEKWRSTSQSTHSSQSQPSPPTPARRRVPRPLPQPPERQSSPGAVRRCYRQQHVPDGMSPPPRRAQSAQSHHQEPRQINGDNWHDPTKSPVKRPHSAGANWKNNPKVAPYNQKPKKNEANECQRANQRDAELTGSGQDMSQITYNPTFQTHSPAHSTKSQQPYIAQIISYPMSQQVAPQSPPKYIAPPEEYQDPQNNVTDNKYANTQGRQTPVTQVNQQSHIYYIHGNSTTAANQDLAQQRQQTVIHLQQYVAMKQAQQQMFSYLQRGPHTVFPNVDYTQTQNPNRVHEGEEFVPQYGHPAMRPHSAPTPVGVVRPMPMAPGFNTMPDGAHMMQMPMWSHMPPVVSTMGPWVPGQVPHEMQYYPQSQFVPMYRPNSAGSAGTLTRYHKKENDNEKGNVCQSINLVRQKQIGQIVSLPGQELTICNSASDSPSPASVSTDSGVSPGNSVPSCKNSVFSTPTSTDTFSNTLDTKNKKNKTAPFNNRSLKNSKSLDS